MSGTNWLTVIASGFAALAPIVLPIIPPPYSLIASGLITIFASYLHLNTPAPK